MWLSDKIVIHRGAATPAHFSRIRRLPDRASPLSYADAVLPAGPAARPAEMPLRRPLNPKNGGGEYSCAFFFLWSAARQRRFGIFGLAPSRVPIGSVAWPVGERDRFPPGVRKRISRWKCRRAWALGRFVSAPLAHPTPRGHPPAPKVPPLTNQKAKAALPRRTPGGNDVDHLRPLLLYLSPGAAGRPSAQLHEISPPAAGKRHQVFRGQPWRRKPL